MFLFFLCKENLIQIIFQAPFELCPGVLISQEMKKMIWSAPPGAKRDFRFIKELAIVAYGPETFGRSTVYGTLKGCKKASDGPKVKEPALDPDILKAIRSEFLTLFSSRHFLIKRLHFDTLISYSLSDELVKRVSLELNIDMKEAEAHERCSKTRISSTLRDAKKKVKKLGYGDGKKTNNVAPELLKNFA